jgi:hypothetical protein
MQAIRKTIAALSVVATGVLSVPLAQAQGIDSLSPAVKRTVSFEADVHGILAERCYSCHGGGKSKGGLDLSSREGLLEGGKTGEAVVDGNSAESYLIELVAGLDEELVMPPKGDRLSAEDVGILRAWIDQGLSWEFSEARPVAPTGPVALRDVTLPAGKTPDENPVDRLLRSYLETQGVERPGVVSDAVFMRRAHWDVIGIPPAPDALTAFEADENPNKRAELVDRLLDNRQAYAEHWMTFWNDALRNDHVGTGYIDGGRKKITNWLYSSLFHNMPYDQFVRQLVHPSEASEGFVKGIVWRGSTAAAQLRELQAARSIAQVFLGVNLKCASCHDSFVDHWTLKDAYGMAAVFREEPMELVRCDVPEGEEAVIKFLWPEVGSIDPERSVQGRQSQLAALVTAEENGYFTRTIVNRLWAQFFGRGLVEPLEVMENPSWHPELLDWLSAELIRSGYDLKAVMALMLASEAYQWSADLHQLEDGEAYVFRGRVPQRLGAEQVLDGLASVTAQWPAEPRFALTYRNKLKKDESEDPSVRAWRFAADPLTRAMGRPNREQVVLRRDREATTLQALALSNGETLAGILRAGAETLLKQHAEATDGLPAHVYQGLLQRLPADAELQAARGLLGDPVTPQGVEDFLWSVIMLPEFQYVY